MTSAITPAKPVDGYDDLVNDLLSLAHAEKKATRAVNTVHLVQEGDVDGLRMFLQSNQSFPINARHPDTGRSLLHEACVHGQKDVVKLLLQHTEADIMLRTSLVKSFFAELAQKSHGADALSRDRFGASPMHYVKSLNVAKLLVQYGARVLDYNSVQLLNIHKKRKNALESVLAFASSVESLNADPAHKNFLKYLEQRAEAEYKAKFHELRQLKKQTKVMKASSPLPLKRVNKRKL